MGQNRVWKYRPTAFDDTSGRPTGKQPCRSLSLLHPVLQRSESVEICEPGTSAAVMNSRNEKQAEEVFCWFATSHVLHHIFVIANRRRRHNGAIGPAMPQENLPITRFKCPQVYRRCVINSSRPIERRRIAVEVEAKRITPLPLPLVRKVPQVLSGQLHVGKSRGIAWSWNTRI